jgi:hypothetical protein
VMITQLTGGHVNVRRPLKNKYIGIAHQLKIEQLAQNYEQYITNHERIKYLKAVRSKTLANEEVSDEESEDE